VAFVCGSQYLLAPGARPKVTARRVQRHKATRGERASGIVATVAG
jgi:hypothetical protein